MAQEQVVSPAYVQNPDVVIREVDDDGALLFNPDTNHVRVVNPTGLFVWNQCEKASDVPTLVAGLKEAFEDVPEAEVPAQIEAFLVYMAEGGFLARA